jgi:hypothetical protein
MYLLRRSCCWILSGRLPLRLLCLSCKLESELSFKKIYDLTLLTFLKYDILVRTKICTGNYNKYDFVDTSECHDVCATISTSVALVPDKEVMTWHVAANSNKSTFHDFR